MRGWGRRGRDGSSTRCAAVALVVAVATFAWSGVLVLGDAKKESLVDGAKALDFVFKCHDASTKRLSRLI
jgi:hypothetical protein